MLCESVPPGVNDPTIWSHYSIIILHYITLQPNSRQQASLPQHPVRPGPNVKANTCLNCSFYALVLLPTVTTSTVFAIFNRPFVLHLPREPSTALYLNICLSTGKDTRYRIQARIQDTEFRPGYRIQNWGQDTEYRIQARIQNTEFRPGYRIQNWGQDTRYRIQARLQYKGQVYKIAMV